MKQKSVIHEGLEQSTIDTVQRIPLSGLPTPLTGGERRHGVNRPGTKMTSPSPRGIPQSGKKIWIDLDNSPHVPFFLPITEELRAAGHEVILTARDSYQVCELLKYYHVNADVIGKHHGKHKLFKVIGTLSRALQLASLIRSRKPDLSLSHGSRACTIASHLVGVQAVVMGDYEFTNKLRFFGPNYVIFPDMVPDEAISGAGVKVLKYPGIKEDVYLSNLRQDPSLRTRMGISEADLLITVRPPATEAHYHNPESEVLLVEALRMFSGKQGIKILLLPRNKRQEAELKEAWAAEIAGGSILIPDHVEDGLNIIWNSDLVISGGGTMNREAAALRVPVYSIFRGKAGAVDRYLVQTGRLTMLDSVADLHSRLRLERRDRSAAVRYENHPALQTILDYVETILKSNNSDTKSSVAKKANSQG